MHLPEREITDSAEIEAILAAGRFTTIAMARGDEPYLVTLSYGYDAEAKTLYFHSAHEGLKLEFMSANPRVCATVIVDRGYLDGTCAHAYSSVVLFGEMSEVEDAAELRHGMKCLTRQLESDPEAAYTKHNLDGDKVYKRMAVLKLVVDSVRGKSGS